MFLLIHFNIYYKFILNRKMFYHICLCLVLHSDHTNKNLITLNVKAAINVIYNIVFVLIAQQRICEIIIILNDNNKSTKKIVITSRVKLSKYAFHSRIKNISKVPR